MFVAKGDFGRGPELLGRGAESGAQRQQSVQRAGLRQRDGPPARLAGRLHGALEQSHAQAHLLATSLRCKYKSLIFAQYKLEKFGISNLLISKSDFQPKKLARID